MKRIDLTGQTIGFWLVGEPVKKGKKIYYKCTCQNCGKEREVYGTELRKGRSQSCGCIAKTGKVEDFLNKDFGMLHVKEKLIINNHTYWRCSCKCGGSKIVSHGDLKEGLVKTCGCRGTFKENVQKAMSKHLVDGTYIPGIERKTLNKNNTSGVRGVSYRADRGKYRAYIKFQRKNIHLGNFDRFEDAVEARKIAEEEYFGQVLVGNTQEVKEKER